ncbi:DUF2501 domain-containing protein [Lichenicoccus sp.]|uniref:DUF2501 domain-containing protein n=1 Tax=Lichenicoccus sp. TaxID=2781899 RepID=UPI003D0AC85E
MKIKTLAALVLVAAGAAGSIAGPARAQLLDNLKGAAGNYGGRTSGLSSEGGMSSGVGMSSGGMGGLSMPSVNSASSSNIGGVLQYCIRNKYLGGGKAGSVKSGLMSKLGSQTGDRQFAAGNRGQLETGPGQSYGLGGGGGIKGRVTDKVCGMVLQHAKSLI